MKGDLIIFKILFQQQWLTDIHHTILKVVQHDSVVFIKMTTDINIANLKNNKHGQVQAIKL